MVQWKHKTKTHIIKLIKERTLFTSIPETYTIQTVLGFLQTTLFETKDAAKYFLTVLGDNILKKPFVARLAYMWFAAVSARFSYYTAWKLADLVCNASGLGFNGYDERGRPKWDLLKNIDILNVEVVHT